MDGIINLYKPPGISSAKALYRVRTLTGVRKSGHAGTLDPAAEGVLLLCLGSATKLVERLMNLPKTYRSVARLDVTSESFDSDRPLKPVPVSDIPTSADVLAAFATLTGAIEQTPPAISAIKIGGRPAYRIQRAGRVPELKPRLVHVYAQTVIRYEWPEVEFETVCGRGTYIRAIIRDVGAALGVGGCLTHLTRVAVGPFLAAEAVSLHSLAAATDWQTHCVPIIQCEQWLSSFKAH